MLLCRRWWTNTADLIKYEYSCVVTDGARAMTGNKNSLIALLKGACVKHRHRSVGGQGDMSPTF